VGRKPKLPVAADFFARDREEAAKPPTRKEVKPLNRDTAKELQPVIDDIGEGPPRTIEARVSEKVTFYIAPDLVKRLELTKVQVLLECNLKVSRSQIVEVILGEMLGRVEEIAELLEKIAEQEDEHTK